MWREILSLTALFFFTMASAGFVLVMIRYPTGSSVRVWGVRVCHGLGFLGVLLMRLSRGAFSEPSLLVVSSLVVSLVAFELTQRMRR